MTRHKSYTIYNWKKRGVITDDFDELYKHHMNINNCELCNIIFDNSSKNKRCLDHDHETGLYRKTLCNGCNSHYQTIHNRLKTCNKSGHLWIANQKISDPIRFTWIYQRKIDNHRVRKAFNTLSKAIAFSFIQLLKKPLS